MLAGFVEVSGGFITGDGAANNIVIHQVGKPDANGFISYRIQGINTKILVAIPSTTTGPPTQFQPPVNSSLITRVNSFEISMSGGNDSLTFYNTTVPGAFSIDMGDGNDTLVMKNVRDLFPGSNPPFFSPVHPDDATIPSDSTITLGAGNDVALLTNVSASGNLFLAAGDGRDTVLLTRVTAGAIKTVFPNSIFGVNMGPGNGDFLSVTHCTGDQTTLQDTGGANGLLIKSGDNFVSEIDAGFPMII